MTTVAEGVQNQDDLDLLTTLECDRIQGFIFARPMQEDALLAWAKQFGCNAPTAPGRRHDAPGANRSGT
jgi:EAL domain-containing protein (putative c-di-GMP-specific phosphodiesterase class I)